MHSINETDNKLYQAIQQLQNGNEEGFSYIYSTTYKYVYSRAKCMFSDEEEALDLVQEVYLAVYKSIGSLEAPEKIYGWLKTIVFYQGTMLLRKKNKEILVSEENEEIFDLQADETQQPEADIMDKQDVEIIRSCIERLSDEQRTVILAYYYDNLRVDEIAELFDINENTVKSRLYLARKKLKEYIEEQEKKQGYKLRSFGGLTLIFALRAYLQQNTQVSIAVQENLFAQICGQLHQAAPIALSWFKKFLAKLSEITTKQVMQAVTWVACAATVTAGIVGIVTKEEETVPPVSTESSEIMTSEIVSETEESQKIYVSDEQIADIKARNIAYRKILEEGTWTSNKEILYFGLYDYDGDGIEEISFKTWDTEYYNSSALLSWKEGSLIYGPDLLADGVLYYCPENNNIAWREFLGAPTADPDIFMPTDGCCVWVFNENHEYIGELYYSGDEYGNYWIESIDETRMCTPEENEEINNQIRELVPSIVMVTGDIKNTKVNRDKYLPIEEEAIRKLLEFGTSTETKEVEDIRSTTDNIQTHVVVTDIFIKEMPLFCYYLEEETLNLTGLKLGINYSNGRVGEISTGYAYAPTTFSTQGIHTITVEYQGVQTKFDVEVIDNMSAAGNCGETARWIQTVDGVIIVYGSGAIADYAHPEYTPWYAVNEKIRKVIIKDGITSIGLGAFAECVNLSIVEMADSVTYIGQNAFADCSNLSDVTLPNRLENINLGVFRGCTKLESLTIPSTVTHLGQESFSGCTALTTLKILNSVCYIYEKDDIGVVDKTVIFGYPGSTAQTYAESHGYQFESLEY